MAAITGRGTALTLVFLLTGLRVRLDPNGGARTWRELRDAIALDSPLDIVLRKLVHPRRPRRQTRLARRTTAVRVRVTNEHGEVIPPGNGTDVVEIVFLNGTIMFTLPDDPVPYSPETRKTPAANARKMEQKRRERQPYDVEEDDEEDEIADAETNLANPPPPPPPPLVAAAAAAAAAIPPSPPVPHDAAPASPALDFADILLDEFLFANHTGGVYTGGGSLALAFPPAPFDGGSLALPFDGGAPGFNFAPAH